MIPVTLNGKTVKLSKNEAAEAQRLYTKKQKGEVVSDKSYAWYMAAVTTESANRRKLAIQSFNL